MAAKAKRRPTAITKLSETPNEGKRNWMIYAPSGEGKTALAGTAPKGLFLTVEAAGTESAKALGSDADEWVTPDWDTFVSAYEWLEGGGHKEFDWVMLDSVTELEEICWADQLESVGKEFEARIQDYGIVDRRLKKMVDKFNRLPINVLYTCQMAAMEMEDEDGDDILKVIPALGRAKNGWPLSHIIQGKVTLIGLLKADTDDDGEYSSRLWVQAGPRWAAKDRHDTFPRYIENPNIAQMAKAVDLRQSTGTKTVVKTPKKAKKKTAA